MESMKTNNKYYLRNNFLSENEYLEQCIQMRNKKKSDLYKEIELLKKYNSRDRYTIENNNREEFEFLKNKLFNDLNICEDEDLRCVFIVFNSKIEYVKTIRLNDFSEFKKDKYNQFSNEYEMLSYYLENEKLYANPAKSFVNKPLKWYKKEFKDMILSFGGWNVNEDGLLVNTEW